MQFPRVWPVWLALIVCVGVLVTDIAVYRPSRARLQRAVQSAKTIGLSLDPSQRPIIVPPAVQEFVVQNSLAEAEASTSVQSGLLTANLLEEITRLAGESGLIVTATEPGLSAQQKESVMVRAQIKVRGTYTELLRYLDALSRGPHLLSVDRFEVLGSGSPELSIQIAVTRHFLKRTRPGLATP